MEETRRRTEVALTEERLEDPKWSVESRVRDDGCGAVATFVGTTRGEFGGKRVISLRYEAYGDMAVKAMKRVCAEARDQWAVEHIAVVHRVGEVKVGEASVAIAVSSVHRRPALEAVHFIIDEIKATVPIWKEEIYQDGSMWKQNAEFEQRFLRKTDLIDEGEHRTSSV